MDKKGNFHKSNDIHAKKRGNELLKNHINCDKKRDWWYTTEKRRGPMKEIKYVVTNPLGVHARPCALLAQCCVNYKSEILVKSNENTADGRNVLNLLALQIKCGDVMNITIEGVDEEEAYVNVLSVIEKEFNELLSSKH